MEKRLYYCRSIYLFRRFTRSSYVRAEPRFGPVPAVSLHSTTIVVVVVVASSPDRNDRVKRAPAERHDPTGLNRHHHATRRTAGERPWRETGSPCISFPRKTVSKAEGQVVRVCNGHWPLARMSGWAGRGSLLSKDNRNQTNMIQKYDQR